MICQKCKVETNQTTRVEGEWICQKCAPTKEAKKVFTFIAGKGCAKFGK